MRPADLLLFEELKKALAVSVNRHQGELSSLEVVRASQELDLLVLKLMRRDRRDK